MTQAPAALTCDVRLGDTDEAVTDRPITSRTSPSCAFPSVARIPLACLRAAHARRGPIADVAYALFAGLIVLLAVLPTGVSATRQTISAYARSPQGDLLRLAFTCLAVGSALAAYEFWRAIPGTWGRLIASLTCLWVLGDVIDTLVEINPIGVSTVHGEIHAVVAVVAFSAVAATVLAFVGWLLCRAAARPVSTLVASVLALVAVAFELVVTASSATFMAGSAERAFFFSSLIWMLAARRTVDLLAQADPLRRPLTRG